MTTTNTLSFGLAALLSVAAWLAPAPEAQEPVAGPAPQLQAGLEQAFAEQGLRIDLEAGLCSIPVEVCMRDDLLEYLMVSDFGATHESLFSTKVTPSVWNTALVALGAEPARGGRFVEKEPLPTDAEFEAGVSPYEVELPAGTPFYFYALWHEGDELRLHRVEDLIGNLRTGRSMERHALRYVGSRMVRADPEKEDEVYLPDMEGNLISVYFFQNDKEIVTTALEDATYDTIWIANTWLVPERGTPVQLITSRKLLDGVPEALKELVAR
ncbi:MAG: hypothetical protein H6831_09760 [Planctomycetes bacterium]|nr:hypothetical protein [Planctomycetota bacterium]MCB9904679.1 hypothetical protein [Planctomycetota bacterium]